MLLLVGVDLGYPKVILVPLNGCERLLAHNKKMNLSLQVRVFLCFSAGP
jgi:hypothetical protein